MVFPSSSTYSTTSPLVESGTEGGVVGLVPLLLFFVGYYYDTTYDCGLDTTW